MILKDDHEPDWNDGEYKSPDGPGFGFIYDDKLINGHRSP